MNAAIPIEIFSAANAGLHVGRMFLLPSATARIYLTTHQSLGNLDILHYHDEPHLSLVAAGAVADKRSDRDEVVGAGKVLMFRAGEPHRTIPLNYPTTHLSVQFEPEFFSANPSLDMALERVASRGPQIELSMARIFRELRAQDEFSTDSIETLIFGMIEGDGLADREPPVWIRRVAEILNDRWNENVTLRELADVADVHPKTVSKYFPAYFSCTFGEYRRRVRIARAVAMVRGTRLPLTEIAHECGFFDQSHFIRVFREMTGVSPRRFRRF